MTGDQIRARFLDFFAAHGHLVLPSAKLLPDDPTTYFTTAGMQPFVPYFLGNERPPRRRIATCQKCLRADDLDEVGSTARHLTFFEMLGNFSFGDYFKRDAIIWGWEFVREGLELDPDRLWVTVYEKDDEAAQIWAEVVGVHPSRIARLGMDDNWWGPVGNSGPCGPCSEILLDRGPDWGDAATPLEDTGGDRYVELWNLVFQQHNAANSKAELKRSGATPPLLPAPGIDTGAGLERIAAAMQGVSTVFESDLLQPLCEAVVEVARAGGAEVIYGADRDATAAINRICDHVRALTFTISDGMFPGNKAGAYVLRQILRRAARFGRLRLGLAEPFLYRLVPAVVARYGEVYPELRESQATVETIVRQEEERFAETLDTGIPRLEEQLDALGAETRELSGKTAFWLYETYGVPIEVQVEVARERGCTVQVAEFEAIRKSRESVHIAGDFSGHGDFGDDLLQDLPATLFRGYDEDECYATVLAIVGDGELDAARGLVTTGQLLVAAIEGQTATFVLDRSPFYAESGGQIGDHGALSLMVEGAEVLAIEIDGVHKDKNGHWLHHGTVSVGRVAVGESVAAVVDTERRDRIRRAHTATHLLHAALRARLGKHVAQAGSLVEPDRLRFDFSHFSALAGEDLLAIEDAVNERILANDALQIAEMPIDEARELGALMFFGEKYGASVRVVNVGEEYGALSTELCGGTHVRRTGDIGQCRITAETSVGSGLRRLEALTGAAALAYAREHEERLRAAAHVLRAPQNELVERIEHLQARLKEAERHLAHAQQATAAGQAAELVAGARELAGLKLVASAVDADDAETVKSLVDDACERLGEGVVLLGAALGGKVVVVCKASDGAVARGVHCGNIVKAAAQAAGGGGGGRPNFAQAGGRDAVKLGEAIAAGSAACAAQLAG